MAAGILLMVVVAVTSAVVAGQQNSFEARQRIAASLAAEELMGRLLTKEYSELAGWNGYSEAVGAMTNVQGNPMPEAFASIGRNVEVLTSLKLLEDLDVRVLGATIRIQAFDDQARVLADISRFVPEPEE